MSSEELADPIDAISDDVLEPLAHAIEHDEWDEETREMWDVIQAWDAHESFRGRVDPPEQHPKWEYRSISGNDGATGEEQIRLVPRDPDNALTQEIVLTGLDALRGCER
jgi:hypothetical protein